MGCEWPAVSTVASLICPSTHCSCFAALCIHFPIWCTFHPRAHFSKVHTGNFSSPFAHLVLSYHSSISLFTHFSHSKASSCQFITAHILFPTFHADHSWSSSSTRVFFEDHSHPSRHLSHYNHSGSIHASLACGCRSRECIKISFKRVGG